MKPAGYSAFVVFTVPIVTTSGVVIERHVIALEVGGTISPSLAVLQDAAIERAMKRLARIRGRIVAAAAAHVAIEQAVDAHLQTRRCPEETQIELFSRRTVREHDRAHATSEAARLDLDRRLADLSADAVIDVGRPVLELAIGLRP